MLDTCTVILDAHGSRSEVKTLNNIGNYRVFFLCDGKMRNDIIPGLNGNVVFGHTHDRLINRVYSKELARIGSMADLGREIGVRIREDIEVKEHYLYEFREQADEPKKYGALQGVLFFSLSRLKLGAIQEVVKYATTISIRCDSLLNQLESGTINYFSDDTVITMKPSITSTLNYQACIPLSVTIHNILREMKWSLSYHSISKAYYDANDNNLDYGALSFYLDQSDRLNCKMKGHASIVLTHSNSMNDNNTNSIDNPTLQKILSDLLVRKLDNHFEKEEIVFCRNNFQILMQDAAILEYVLGLNNAAFTLGHNRATYDLPKCTCGTSYELKMPDNVHIIWDACRTLEKRDFIVDRCDWQMPPKNYERHVYFIENRLHINQRYTIQAIKYLADTAPDYWSKNIFSNISEFWEEINNLLYLTKLVCFVLQHKEHFLLGTIVNECILFFEYEKDCTKATSDFYKSISQRNIQIGIKNVGQYSNTEHFGVIVAELMLSILSIKSQQDFLLQMDNTSLTGILSPELASASKKLPFMTGIFKKMREKHMCVLEQYDKMLQTQDVAHAHNESFDNSAINTEIFAMEISSNADMYDIA